MNPNSFSFSESELKLYINNSTNSAVFCICSIQYFLTCFNNARLHQYFFYDSLKAQCKYHKYQFKHVKIFSLLFNFQYSAHVDVLPDIKVDPSVNSYELLNLRSGSMYCMELSAVTAAGEGKRSESKCFETSGTFISH